MIPEVYSILNFKVSVVGTVSVELVLLVHMEGHK